MIFIKFKYLMKLIIYIIKHKLITIHLYNFIQNIILFFIHYY